MNKLEILEGLAPVATTLLTNVLAALSSNVLGCILLVALLLAAGYALKWWRGGKCK